jgi:hypothetical protein
MSLQAWRTRPIIKEKPVGSHRAEFGPKSRSPRKNPVGFGALPKMPRPIENAEYRAEREEMQLADPLAMRLMLGTAEAYDGLEQDVEWRAAAAANARPRGGSTNAGSDQWGTRRPGHGHGSNQLRPVAFCL